MLRGSAFLMSNTSAYFLKVCISCVFAYLPIAIIIFACGRTGVMRQREISKHSSMLKTNLTGKKVILSWTKFFGRKMDDKYFDNCPEMREICELTDNRYLYDKADAIVFHPPDMKWTRIPPQRWPHQRYVFLLHESPSFHALINLDRVPDFFNWTMTYRLDSDIAYPYGYLLPDPSARQALDVDAILNKTSRALVWFVSNCESPSKRKWYVKMLQKHIRVDIYGRCGPYSCSQATAINGSLPTCEQELIEKKYKFYLAFENSVCRDYITEKFYRRWKLNSVPIVLSRAVVQDLLPPKSYIAVDDFPRGPRQLAEYLKSLMDNDEEYLKYSEWKRTGYSNVQRNPKTGLQWGFCGLCEKLWRADNVSKSYKSVYSWWGEKVSCDNDLVDRLIWKQ